MKFLFLIFTILIFSHSACAQTISIEERQNALSEAMIKADAARLKQLTAAELSYGHSSGRVEDQATFIANLVSGASDFVSIQLENQQIQQMDDLAIVRHTLVAETNDSGKPGQVKIGVMLLWQLRAEKDKVEASEFMVDKIADQQAAANMLDMADASRSTLSGLDGALSTLEQTMATQVGRIVELQDMLSRPNDLDGKTRRQAKKELKELDKQAYKTQQTLNAARTERSAIQQTTEQAIEQYAARHNISKQAQDNNEQIARTMSLRKAQKEWVLLARQAFKL